MKPPKKDMSNVMIGFPTGGSPSVHFLSSLVFAYRKWPKMGYNFVAGSRIAHNRNMLVRHFLNDKTFDWLLMIDDDMVVPAESIERLCSAVKDEPKVVGGLAFLDDNGIMQPTIMYAREDGPGYMRAVAWKPDTLIEVQATGTAFLLMGRDLLERMGERYMERHPMNWFEETVDTVSHRSIGEDVTFCERLAEMGEKLYVHTGAKVGHEKSVILTDLEFGLRRRNGALIVGERWWELGMILNALNVPCGMEVGELQLPYWRFAAAPAFYGFSPSEQGEVWGTEQDFDRDYSQLREKLLRLGINREQYKIDAAIRNVRSLDNVG